MKKIIILSLLLISTFVAYSQFKVPNHEVEFYVNDFTGTLNKAEKQAILTKLEDFEKISSIQIVVVLLDDFQGYEIEDITLAIGRKWGIGQKGLNNGILYLISPKNRKGRIEVGMGLEGDITDAFGKEIQIPVREFYRKGDYNAGINNVIGNLITKLKPISWEQRQKFKKEKEKEATENLVSIGNWILNILLFGSIVFLIVFLYLKAQKKAKEKKLRLEKLNNEYENTILKLKQLKNDLWQYKTLFPDINTLVEILLNNINAPLPSNEEQFANKFETLQKLLDSNSVKHAIKLIKQEKRFSETKTTINNYLDYNKFKITDLTVLFEDVKNYFLKVKEEYTQLFSKIVDEKYLKETFNRKIKEVEEKINLLKRYQQNTEELRNTLITDENYITNLITDITNVFAGLNNIIDQYKLYSKNVTDKLYEIETRKKHWITNLDILIKGYKSKKYVSESTKQLLDIELKNAVLRNKEWSAFPPTIKTDLVYMLISDDIVKSVEKIYNIDFQIYKKEQDRLEKIRQEEERERKRRQDEEDRRRRARQEEEDRRRDSYVSSISSSSTNTDSSYNSGGGGSFSGGGTSDSW